MALIPILADSAASSGGIPSILGRNPGTDIGIPFNENVEWYTTVTPVLADVTAQNFTYSGTVKGSAIIIGYMLMGGNIVAGAADPNLNMRVTGWLCEPQNLAVQPNALPGSEQILPTLPSRGTISVRSGFTYFPARTLVLKEAWCIGFDLDSSGLSAGQLQIAIYYRRLTA